MVEITKDKLLIEVGKGKSSYTVRYSFNASNEHGRANLYYRSLNTHSGYKKRLVRVKPDGTRTLIARTIT